KDRRDAAEEIVDDCITDCMNDCTEKHCNGNGNDAEPESAPKTFKDKRKRKSIGFALPALESGKAYVGRLSFQGTINTSDVSFAIGGKFTPGERAADGTIETRIEVNELEVRMGLFTLKS